jgi:hypothetical protein
MQSGQHIPSRLQTEILQGGALERLWQRLHQRVNHHVADMMDTSGVHAFAEEILVSVF